MQAGLFCDPAGRPGCRRRHRASARVTPMDRAYRSSRASALVAWPRRGRICDHASDQVFCRGAGDENRTRTISLGMSAAGSPGQPDPRSWHVLVGPRVTVEHPLRPPHRARNGHSCPRCDLSAHSVGRMGALRRLGQNLDLIYRDDSRGGRWVSERLRRHRSLNQGTGRQLIRLCVVQACPEGGVWRAWRQAGRGGT